jgi:hypothetical protein
LNSVSISYGGNEKWILSTDHGLIRATCKRP